MHGIGFVFLLVVVMGACGAAAQAAKNCDVTPVVEGGPTVAAGFESMERKCVKAMKAQVNEELTAALTYMAMGAHFSEDAVNRPGFAKMFFESASEEREHAMKIIEYLLMRGELEGKLESEELIANKLEPKEVSWDSPLAALKAALELEISVTKSITGIVTTCEKAGKETALFHNDYHLVDYLTGVFLEEQLHGQRELAGKISTLGKMVDAQGVLAEFLFDKKLLSGEPL